MAPQHSRHEGYGDNHPIEPVDLGPATAVAVGLIATGLAANAWLIHMGHAPLTALARSPQGRAFRAYFDRHCDQALVVDLLSIAGRFVPTRRIIP